MAMVTCPNCKKIVNDASGKCPNCGKALKGGTVDKSTPSGKIKLASSVLITISCILLFLEFFEVGKTYIGGLLLGAGFILHGVSQAMLKNDESYIGKNKVIIIYVIGVAVFISGIFFLIMELR